ncbi:MAG: hypothetical protein LC808_09545 [Actinobacteria bacterium]|nr:hypothetical protein [Actinomycetota bacterium]
MRVAVAGLIGIAVFVVAALVLTLIGAFSFRMLLGVSRYRSSFLLGTQGHEIDTRRGAPQAGTFATLLGAACRIFWDARSGMLGARRNAPRAFARGALTVALAERRGLLFPDGRKRCIFDAMADRTVVEWPLRRGSSMQCSLRRWA